MGISKNVCLKFRDPNELSRKQTNSGLVPKDAAEGLIAERQAAAQAARDREASRAEEEENRKFHGTAVTRASFLEWRARFRRELAEAEERRREEQAAEDKKRKVKPEEKLTGTQLWERGLVGKVEEDDDEDGEDALKAFAAVKVSEGVDI